MIQVYHNPNFIQDFLNKRISDMNSLVHVADVVTEDPGAAYRLTQIDFNIQIGKIEVRFIKPLKRSTSAGDLLIHNGVKYFVDGIGYELIEE